jgi:hypothetical protein
VQHLGGTDAVEDLDAEQFRPALADVRRQRLARRSADAQPRHLGADLSISGLASSAP